MATPIPFDNKNLTTGVAQAYLPPSPPAKQLATGGGGGGGGPERPATGLVYPLYL